MIWKALRPGHQMRRVNGLRGILCDSQINTVHTAITEARIQQKRDDSLAKMGLRSPFFICHLVRVHSQDLIEARGFLYYHII